MDDVPFTVPNVILTLKEFLIVWLNQVLYTSNIYPTESYTKRKSFDVIVHITRSPSLQKYLEDFVDEFLNVLVSDEPSSKSGNVCSLIIVLFEQANNKVKEKYCVKMDHFVSLGDLNVDVSTIKTRSFEAETQKINIVGFDWNTVYSDLRSLLSQHVQELSRRQSNRLPFNDIFFKAVIDTSEHVNLSASEKWVKVGDTRSPATQLPKVVPIGQVSTGFLQFGCVNEYAK
ncbi:hypothetical protein PGUG_01965 [Meyerozyma guilliermondii ATCC 6260]|uniref:HORMA domain-containing protein n=1 Tax=Meyerozyma guilliermondii (strain ATCC 6260 / CBS 566 / DSM 6381 / JCM 1539 / NBRC 10279 / NRRL Y-324) TaxID=294746 RepID=A5DFB4_PICGU|nr:uncharacterized protein PGUG_01965 [Meyerozyma guilliermondii ATCC 6260]EDK37867.2 hypothetical protein PGUG_01965 [Meyerozyma guilliermondii ATCC 6260]